MIFLDKDDYTATIFAALADPTRIRLLLLLKEQSDSSAICVSALAMLLGISQPAVSQHLSVLKTAGLVEGEKRGNYMHYFVKPDALERCQRSIDAVLRSENQNTRVDLCKSQPCPD